MNEEIEIYSFKNKSEADELLNNSRLQIDEIDNNLFELICKRTSLAKDIVLAKMYLEMPIYDKSREQAIFEKSQKLAKEKNIDADIIEQIMNMLTILSKNEQNEILRRVENGKY
ncbi:MAG: chorismate mutase [Methanobrevibacter sp.]|uniref:chorismate mutase n=1 Tax=Methanobrevibacter sp. TaxID=66852 RepID=UPI0026DEF20D|nr:chorismate mutase [Methanobrevibacter sp.]MDO5848314.1 chorismate mutase [Methanobrevibacter sp.]